MRQNMRKGLCLLLCVVLLLPLTACNGDEGYFKGMRALRAGNYQEAYEHFRASTDTRAPKMLAKFAWVPVTVEEIGKNTNRHMVYTYDEAGYPTKAVQTITSSDDTERVSTSVYTYTDGVKRVEKMHNTSTYADNKTNVYDNKGNLTYSCIADNDGSIIEETFYVYDGSGNLLLSDMKYYSRFEGTESELYDRSEYTYDDKGRILSMTRHENLYVGSTITETYTYAEDGSYVKSEKRDASGPGARDGYEHQIHYDTEGRIVRWLYVNYDGDSRSEVLDEYRYDDKGNKIYSYHKVDDTAITGSYVYDEKNRLLEMKELDNTGAIKGWVQNTYDEKGNPLTEHSSTDGILWNKTSYTYAEDGTLTEKSTGDGNNRWEKTTYQYNEDGTVKMQETIGSSGTVVISFGYDGWGNLVSSLTQKTPAGGNRAETSVKVTRELHYYPDGVPEDITEWLDAIVWE